MSFAQFIRNNNAMDTAEHSSDIDNMCRFRLIEPKLSKAHRVLNENVDPPIERSGHRMLIDEDYIYLIGGYCPWYSEQLIQEIWRFNILTEEWELLEVEGDEFPAEMASFSLCSESDWCWQRAFLFGGTTVPFGEESSNEVTLLTKSPDGKFRWHPLSLQGEQPVQQYGSAIVMKNGVLYQIGGTTGHAYNMEIRSLTPVWEDRGSNPSPSNIPQPDYWRWRVLKRPEDVWGRYRHEVEVIGDEIVIIGGGNPHWASTLETLLIFDLLTNEFVKRPTIPDVQYGYPPPRMCHASVKYKGNIYIIGGCSEKRRVAGRRRGNVTEIPDVYNDVWKLDTTQWKWSKLEAKLFNKTCFHAAVVSRDGCVYVFGGAVDGAFTKRCSVMQRVWLDVPRLEYLSMRRVLANHPTLPQQRPFDIPQLTLSNPRLLVHEALEMEQKREQGKDSLNNNEDRNNSPNFTSYLMKLVLG